MSEFADRLTESGSSAVAELSEPIGAEPSAQSTTPSDGGASNLPDPVGAGRDATPVPGALPPAPASANVAPVTPVAPVAIPSDRAVEVLRADPNFAPFLELQQQVSSGDLREVLGRFQQFAEDPFKFWKEMGDQLRAAGMLQAEPAAAPAKPFALPEADLRTEDGSQTAYSATAVGKIVESLMAHVDSRIQPFQGEHERLQAERQRADAERATSARLEAGHAQLRQAATDFEGFNDLLPAIHDLVIADQQKPVGQRRFGDVPNLAMAYIVAKQSHQPALEERARQTVVSDLNARAAAGTAPTRRRAATGSESREPGGGFKARFKNKPEEGEALLEQLGLN